MTNTLPKSAIIDTSYLSGASPDLDIVKLINYDQAVKGEIVAMQKEGTVVHCITTNAFPDFVESIKKDLAYQGFEIKSYYTDPESFKLCLKWYDRISDIELIRNQKANFRASVKGIEAEKLLLETYSKKDLFHEAELLKEIIRLAFQAGASDLHRQSEFDGAYLRIRKDGILKTILKLPQSEYNRYIGTVKFLSDLKINVDFMPQDGRMGFQTMMTGVPKQIDVRVSTMPGLRGENVVMRYLDSTKTILSLEQIGFRSDYLTQIQKALDKTTGMIIVTGPTGSGKTTTLYTMLSMLNDSSKKVITLEDPIEYEIAGIQQSQVNIKKGYTFEKGLEAILRQDPDIILIGEIRSVQTAEIAINAALTGHLVLTTLHTNSAIDAISRLQNMGVKSHMLAPALNCIMGQRLVRVLDTDSKKKLKMTNEIQKELDDELNNVQVNHPELIPKKSQIYTQVINDESDGYLGRTAIAEVLTVDDAVEQMIVKNFSTIDILTAVKAEGYTTLTEDGYLKALQGVTSLEELKRVL